ncbi:MAG TPA: selenocysteine-specific translation elongation factor, partial [Terriglobales bacterium]
MKSIIVGTAGHIDHGKTALVKALTGIDADRLEEEKRRGITIDLGFAHWETSAAGGEKLRFGFVDVPGHERFVRNMLAGVGGIDLVLLVIAADEGIKPQTREHFDICRLLSIQRGITVLTKSDLVDSDTLDVVRMEVEDFLRGSFLESAPIIPVSSLKGTGLDELKAELIRAAADLAVRDSAAIARLPIDRVFTMKGFGTVVTGTLIAGSVQKDEELELFPAKKRVRVRGVQVHGSSSSHAVAGERTALNLVGVEKSDLARGMMLATPGVLEPSSRFDVKLSLLRSARPLKSGARVHLHAFSAETIAIVRLLEGKQMEPGSDGFAQVQTGDPLLLVPGDRFIIRQFSPVITIGGGIVLDAFAPKKIPLQASMDFLKALSAGDFKTAVLARISRRGQDGIAISQIIAETGSSPKIVRSTTSDLESAGAVVRFQDLLIEKHSLAALVASVRGIVADFHASNPLVAGISKDTLREKSDTSQLAFEAALDAAVGAKQLQVSQDLVHLPGRGVVMKD